MRWILLTGAMAAALILWTACEETVGEPVDVEQLGYKICEKHEDCEPFGYCNGSGYCDLECRQDADCSLSHTDWEHYICDNYHCVLEWDIKEEDEDEDVQVDGDDGGSCEYKVVEDSSCHYWTPEECASYGWTPFCPDIYCAKNGWKYSCNSDGKCVDNCEVNYGSPEGTNIEDYAGVYATVFTTAVRNEGIPGFGAQDTVSIHHALSRIWEQDGKMMITHKTCRLGLYNFRGDKIYYEDIAQMVTPEAYFNNVAFVQHVVEDPPAMEAGATFETSRFWEIRGAKLQSIECDVTDNGQHENCEEDLPDQEAYNNGDSRIWDQDFDDKPAMTTIMKGAISGEIYSVQRWSTQWSGEVLDKDRLWGTHFHTTESNNVDATNETLKTTIHTVIHPDADRSYYRMMRVPEDTTCEEVIEMGDDENEWIRFTPHMDPDTVLDLPEE